MLSIKCAKKVFPWLVLSVLIIAGYNGLLYMICGPNFMGSDPFCKTFCKSKLFTWTNYNGSDACSHWPVLHFIWFALLTYFFPDCWKELFLFGILWEIIETVLGIILKDVVPIQRSGGNNSSSGQYDGRWWCGSVTDIIFNTAGILLGLSLARLTKSTSDSEEKAEKSEEQSSSFQKFKQRSKFRTKRLDVAQNSGSGNNNHDK